MTRPPVDSIAPVMNKRTRDTLGWFAALAFLMGVAALGVWLGAGLRP
jgi:hypothetical protein